MIAEPCTEMHLLIQAERDGELPVADIARLHAHLEGCAACTRTRRQLAELSRDLRAAVPRYEASAGLRATLARRHGRRPGRNWGERAAGVGVGAALAACLLLALLPGGQDTLADAVVAAHIRALQPGHLMDVLSTDRHTVRPWFDGRLPFAPPVKDVASAGYPLVGGRLDYLHGHTAAALVYRAGPHLIDLFAWPGAAADGEGERQGYNFVRWSEGAMTFWAVSDLAPAELAAFVRRWRGA